MFHKIIFCKLNINISINSVKMQLWLHVPYYGTKSPYISILYTILLHLYGIPLFAYSDISKYGQSRIQYNKIFGFTMGCYFSVISGTC